LALAVMAEIAATGDEQAAVALGHEAHAARHALEVEEAKHARTGVARPAPDVRFDRLQLRIYDDELALGVSCAGNVARVAHETSRLLAAFAR
jgi:hypothetical protein